VISLSSSALEIKCSFEEIKITTIDDSTRTISNLLKLTKIGILFLYRSKYLVKKYLKIFNNRSNFIAI